MKGCDLYDRLKEVDDAVETLVIEQSGQRRVRSILSGQADGEIFTREDAKAIEEMKCAICECVERRRRQASRKHHFLEGIIMHLTKLEGIRKKEKKKMRLATKKTEV